MFCFCFFYSGMDRSKRAEVSSYPAEGTYTDRRTDRLHRQTESSSPDLDLTADHKRFFTKFCSIVPFSSLFSNFLTYTATISDELKCEKYKWLDLKCKGIRFYENLWNKPTNKPILVQLNSCRLKMLYKMTWKCMSIFFNKSRVNVKYKVSSSCRIGIYYYKPTDRFSSAVLNPCVLKRINHI